MSCGLLSLKWNNHKSTFFHVLSLLRQKESYADVTIACDGKFYSLHKFVLSTCSEYFEEMFEKTSCKNPVIVLKDIHCEELEALLNYMYIGEVNVLQEKLAGLIKAAECLKIKGLAVPDEDPAPNINTDAQKKETRLELGPNPKKRKKEEESEVEHSTSKYCNRNSYNSNCAQTNFHEDKVNNDANRISLKDDTLPVAPTQNIDPVSSVNDDIEEAIVKEESKNSIKAEDALDVKDSSNELAYDGENNDLGEHFMSSPLLCNDQSNNELSDLGQGNSLIQNSFSLWDNPEGEGGSDSERSSGNSSNPNIQRSTLLKLLSAATSSSARDSPSPAPPSPASITPGQNLFVVLPNGMGIKCLLCSYVAFGNSSKSRIRGHMLTHTNEKPFSCPLCAYRSNFKSAVVRHIKGQHPEYNEALYTKKSSE